MPILPTLGFVGALLLCYVTVWYGISIFIRRNDVADVAWGPGIALASFGALYVQNQFEAPMILLLGLVTLWATRLAVRVGLRNAKKKEDPRYRAWRDSWGSWFYIRSYFQVFLLQGTLMLIMAYPFIHSALWGNIQAGPLFFVGVVLWILGFLFETISDYQLDRFIANPENKGHIMNTGLWRYSRHPNYFGEVLMWWALWIAIMATPYSIYALISPLLITFLIFRVSGIPMLEKLFADNPEFEEYKRKTSVFFPLPPKK